MSLRENMFAPTSNLRLGGGNAKMVARARCRSYRALWRLPAITLALVCTASLGRAQDIGSSISTQSVPYTTTPGSGYQQTNVASPPMQPITPTRPTSWPATAPVQATPWSPPLQVAQNPGIPVAVPVTPLQPCTGTMIVARVGSEAVLDSEMPNFGRINAFVAERQKMIPADIPERQRNELLAQLEQKRQELLEKEIRNRIETKLVLLDAKREIPAEAWPKIESDMAERFEETQVPELMKKAKVSTRAELEQRCREEGSSLEQIKRIAIEQAIVSNWLGMKIKHDEEVTFDQKRTYYQTHTQEFASPARAEWEELVVSFRKHPDKQAAYAAIAQMWNMIVRQGAPFAEVAKAHSDGLTATNGGKRGWITQGSLASAGLDRAVFTLPVGQMSPVLEEPDGFHVVRVIQRQEVTVKPFEEAQVAIEKKIRSERTKKQQDEYLARLEARTPIGIFPDGDPNRPQTARQPTDVRQR